MKMLPAVIQPNHTAVQAISTPDDENNYYSQLPDLLDPTTGLPIFKTIKIGLSCEACLAKNKPCPHRSKHVPQHISGRRRLIAQAILEKDETTKAQETLGIVAGTTIYCYSHAWVDSFLRGVRWLFPRPVQVLFSSLDPHVSQRI